MKDLYWMGDSRKRLSEFPEEVQSEVGYALYLAECGEPYPSAKHMHGYNAIEIVSDYDGDTSVRYIHYQRAPPLPEEVQDRLRNASGRY